VTALPLPDRSARRAALLDAADRVVRRDGPATSMSAVAAEAGISKPILYRHFGGKAGLTAALAERHTDRLQVVLRDALALGGSREGRVERTIRAYLEVIEEDPQTYRFLMRPEEPARPPEQLRSFTQGLVDLLAAGIAAELRLPVGVREVAWAHAIVGLVQSAGDWWLDAQPCSREELAGHLTDLLRGAYTG
jgi:AcrR family transcriptional regulator